MPCLNQKVAVNHQMRNSTIIHYHHHERLQRSGAVNGLKSLTRCFSVMDKFLASSQLDYPRQDKLAFRVNLRAAIQIFNGSHLQANPCPGQPGQVYTVKSGFPRADEKEVYGTFTSYS